MQAFLLGTVAVLKIVETAAPEVEALRAVYAAGGIEAALRAVPPDDWIALVGDVATAAPQIQATWATLHPAFDAIVTDLKNGIEKHDVASNASAWFRANQPATIPGRGPDGSLIEIPNPDK